MADSPWTIGRFRDCVGHDWVMRTLDRPDGTCLARIVAIRGWVVGPDDLRGAYFLLKRDARAYAGQGMWSPSRVKGFLALVGGETRRFRNLRDAQTWCMVRLARRAAG